MTKYKIEKRWDENFSEWEWKAYEEVELWWFKFWSRIVGTTSYTREKTEMLLKQHIQHQKRIAEEKKESSEQYFLDL